MKTNLQGGGACAPYLQKFKYFLPQFPQRARSRFRAAERPHGYQPCPLWRCSHRRTRCRHFCPKWSSSLRWKTQTFGSSQIWTENLNVSFGLLRNLPVHQWPSFVKFTKSKEYAPFKGARKVGYKFDIKMRFIMPGSFWYQTWPTLPLIYTLNATYFVYTFGEFSRGSSTLKGKFTSQRNQQPVCPWTWGIHPCRTDSRCPLPWPRRERF